MSKGNWSFLHEWVIYDYLISRSAEGTLRLKKIIGQGKLLGKSKWLKVESIMPISGTKFPDIKGLKFKSETHFRPAEVKFTTSLFNYHLQQKHLQNYAKFYESSGLIIVASHDYLPANGFLEKYPNIEVFEIDIEDFITYSRENFTRLLNRQIKAHTQTRVWLLYQGPNFNEGAKGILPARTSMIWCPTENLNSFDLAPGDRIIFFKTLGVGRIELQNKFQREKEIDKKWVLKELYLAEVKSKIFSRSEFSDFKGKSHNIPLWKNDPKLDSGSWRWNRVFEFKKIKEISLDKSLSELISLKSGFNFVFKAWEAFCFGKSREISLQDYRDLLEILI